MTLALNFKGFKKPLLKERILLLCFFLIVGLVFYLALYGPSQKETVTLAATVDGLRHNVEKNKNLIADIEKYAKRLQEVSESYELMVIQLASSKELMPKDNDILATLREITSPQPGLSFMSIEPSAKRNEGAFVILPVDVNVRGSFSSLGQFLSKLEKSSSHIGVESINISRDTKPGLSASLTLAIYMMSEGGI